eukprot:CAMPEP_0113494430 /NCGR_PEP_ID=MMETSP0014_2-20120614/29102_1 /TAXON_ID=2857 /ORGANISM="Nitzschia sp." /LENGTH=265 /DNA_ID=CAMNT_0000388321 /DNA_START=87 /DNA_END=884 /DNA_ORIENTATION=+ /assembly_acc=CAM_ASM_000159
MSGGKRSKNLTSMEVMIYNANQVLTDALRPSLRGVPKGYFQTCAGVAIISTIQAGLIFSGSVGTGILMKRNLDGSWSNPVAVGMTGVGFGFLVGANLKDIIVFFPDDESIQTCFKSGVELSAQSNITAVVGREFEGAMGVSGSGTSAVVSIAYSKGAFIGASMQGAVVGPRHKANEIFYGQPADPVAIMDGKIPIPTEKENTTLLSDVKTKLTKCANGESEVPGAAEEQKNESALQHAEQASEAIGSIHAEEVTHVDIEAEAKKE